jgi:hypothetical protein
MRSLVEEMISPREAGRNFEVPCEENARLRRGLADEKEENDKLKEEQLRAAAAAAEAAEAARLAQLAAQSQANSAQIGKIEQALETLRASLPGQNALIEKLEDQRNEFSPKLLRAAPGA